MNFHVITLYTACFCYRINDIIVSVNGVNCVGVSHGDAVEALKQAGYNVTLVS